MPNPNMLYAVTGIVVALLAVWIGLVFKNAKEPWAKAGLPVKDSVPSKFSTIVDEEPADKSEKAESEKAEKPVSEKPEE